MMIVIYGSDGCHYCKQAVKACEASDVPHKYLDIVEDEVDMTALQESIGHQVRSVPQIFDGDDYIGGFVDLLGHLRENAE